MIIQIPQKKYNASRFKKPWIARIAKWDEHEMIREWGEFEGTPQDGGIMIAEAAVGDIIEYGVSDNRKTASVRRYYHVLGNQDLKEVTRTAAYKLFFKKHNSKVVNNETRSAKEKISDIFAEEFDKFKATVLTRINNI